MHNIDDTDFGVLAREVIEYFDTIGEAIEAGLHDDEEVF